MLTQRPFTYPTITVLLSFSYCFISNISLNVLYFRINYIEIYNEKVYDLLNKRSELKIKELPSGDVVFGDGEGGQLVRSEDEILKAVDAGNTHRKVAETNMNVQSSRSHAILQIVSSKSHF